MKTYIGVKMIEAVPMSYADYWFEKDKRSTTKADNKEGYKVEYPDGHVSWSPKETFESAYFPILNKDKIVPEDVMGFIDDLSFIQKFRTKTGVVVTGTRVGYDCIHIAACAVPENYDTQVALSIGREKSIGEVWGLLSFVLNWAVRGLKKDKGPKGN